MKTPILAIAAFLLPAVAAAQPTPLPNTPYVAPSAPTRDQAGAAPKRTQPETDNSRWSLNFTPVLLAPHGDYRFGGGGDPELKYTLDRGGARLSAGLRVGAYYAQNLVGITAMPTIRLTVPVGPVEPYASFGLGYGWLPKLRDSDIATMSRLGVVFRFTKNFALGVEGTIQKIDNSDFAFPSFGSALNINF